MEFNKILIAVDDSAYSLKAARIGFALARELKAEIAVIFVVDQSLEVLNPDIGMTREQSKSTLLKEAENTIDQIVEMYEHDGKVLRFMPEGLPGKQITEIAKQWQASVIVMGNRPKSGLEKIMIRSVTEFVISHAGIPVLLTSVEDE